MTILEQFAAAIARAVVDEQERRAEERRVEQAKGAAREFAAGMSACNDADCPHCHFAHDQGADDDCRMCQLAPAFCGKHGEKWWDQKRTLCKCGHLVSDHAPLSGSCLWDGCDCVLGRVMP